jgi:hypothetical protein
MNYGKRFDPNTITDAELIAELKALSEKLGKTPSRNDMKNGTDITQRLWLYTRRFGGLQEAQVLAGLIKNIGGTELTYSEEELLTELGNLMERLGHTPTQDEINKNGKYPIGAYKRHFGTYNKALEKLSISPNVKFGVSPEEIKQDIIRIYNLLGRAPTAAEFSKLSTSASSVTAYHKISGNDSWNDILKICGIPIVYNKNLTDQELKDEVVRLEKDLGRLPGYYDMVLYGKYSAETYAFRYGTYVKALQHLGFNYIPQSKWENQTFTLGKDGTLYKSNFEANIANALKELKEAGKIDQYTYEYPVCPEHKWSCDFLVRIGGKVIWLEADGMGKNRPEVYSADSGKIKYYADHGLNYIILEYRRAVTKERLSELMGLV